MREKRGATGPGLFPNTLPTTSFCLPPLVHPSLPQPGENCKNLFPDGETLTQPIFFLNFSISHPSSCYERKRKKFVRLYRLFLQKLPLGANVVWAATQTECPWVRVKERMGNTLVLSPPGSFSSRLPLPWSLELMENSVSGLLLRVWSPGPTISKLFHSNTKRFFALFIVLLSWVCTGVFQKPWHDITRDWMQKIGESSCLLLKYCILLKRITIR